MVAIMAPMDLGLLVVHWCAFMLFTLSSAPLLTGGGLPR